MCEMAFCSGKLQQKTKLMCLRPLIFIKKTPTNYCCKKFATVIEESVVTYPDCLFITISYLFQRKCYLLEYYRLQVFSIESHRFCNHRLFLLRSIAQFYTNLNELFCHFISYWVNSGKFMDNC